MKTLLSSLFALLFSFTLVAQISENETAALNDLYASTQGEHWNQKWDLTKSAANFDGVTIENGHVTEIRMLFNNLSGNLPASLVNLTQLKVLELSFNELTGEIPAAYGEFQNLEVLALNGNSLSGSLPATLVQLENLKQLHLSSNDFSGTLPANLAALKQLEVFNVFDNNFSGTLPIALASNRKLREFMVAENNFENASEISTVLLLNSAGHLDLKENSVLNPSGKSIIAVESSEDEN